MADEITTETAAETGVSDAPQTSAGPTAADIAGWAGYKLDEIGGATVGKVEGVYVDEGSGRPEWLLARMGRFGAHCLVPARDAVGVAGHVWVPYSRDEIRRAPRVEANSPIQREAEQAMLAHYGVGTPDVGRGAELAKRDSGAITARPA